MTVRDTHHALAALTDEGIFERVATAVLREADARCAAIAHTGVNVDGMTRKAPLDAVGYVPGAYRPHLVAAHHTIAAPGSLRRKWLLDPATIVARAPGRATTAPPGDVVKTARIVADERVRTPDLRATLFLTTNQEPDETLVRDVHAFGAAHRLDVELWSRSRLAHFLDHHATGQSIRRHLLGIDQVLLSRDLLRELSLHSLDLIPQFDEPSLWVPRALDGALEASSCPVTFVVGDSGSGKSVACLRTLRAHLDAGGLGLVLPHECVDAAATPEHAVDLALRHLHPTLAPGQSAFIHGTLLIAVEDVNRSPHPLRLVQKIATWARSSRGGRTAANGAWRALCPLWPQVLAQIDEQARRALEPMLLFVEPMTPAEGCRAVQVRAERADRKLSDVTAEQISAALGHEPLLIALHDFDTAPDAHDAIGRFVERELIRAQAVTSEVASDLRRSLLPVAVEMLRRRSLAPRWSDVSVWELPPAALDRLRRLCTSGSVVRLSGPPMDPVLSFRHDRIRDWLFVEAATERSVAEDLDEAFLAEPFFAEVLGAVLARRAAPRALLDRLAAHNPLALFHALRVLPGEQPDAQAVVAQAISDWLAAPATSGRAHDHLRWHGASALMETDAGCVVTIAAQFPERHPYAALARLHNGDLRGGIEVCARWEPSMHMSLRDRQIAHAKLHFGARLIDEACALLRTSALPVRARTGLLRFCGHLASAALLDAAETCWRLDTSRTEHLFDYLWLFARCADELSSARFLDQVCEAWAAVSTETNGRHLSDRAELDTELGHAFEQHPPIGALAYLVSRAEQPDLAHSIGVALANVDHPTAVAVRVQQSAARMRTQDALSGLVFTSIPPWERAHGRQITQSRASRELLLSLWQPPDADPAQRRAAFRMWASTHAADDVSRLHAYAEDSVLRDDVLMARLLRRDGEVISALIEKLRDPNDWRWWCSAGLASSPAMTQFLDETLARRRQGASTGKRVLDDRFCDLILRLPVEEAEAIVRAHWNHLGDSATFVQAAFYLATPETIRLAAAAVARASKPAALFKHLGVRYGIRMTGHPGVTREAQILAVAPYVELLSDNDVWDLADACNLNGWFVTRKRFFDARVDRRIFAWKIEEAAQVFDELVSTRGIHWLNNEMENALRCGVSWPELLAALDRWFDARRSIDAMELVALALKLHGARADIAVLRRYDEVDAVAAEAIIADSLFAIRRRTAA